MDSEQRWAILLGCQGVSAALDERRRGSALDNGSELATGLLQGRETMNAVSKLETVFIGSNNPQRPSNCDVSSVRICIPSILKPTIFNLSHLVKREAAKQQSSGIETMDFIKAAFEHKNK